MDAALLDRRYAVSSLLCASASARRFAGCHVSLDAPVRIVELRPPNQPHPARTWGAAECAALAARAAALRHPALPRVRDCFYAHGVSYVVEDALEEERLAARLAGRRVLDLRAALRDGLLLCDALACVAREAPELLECLLIAGATLAYDAGGVLHLTTWDYSRLLDGRSTLEPGAPDLRAPEVRAGDISAPDERAHVYGIAALLAFLLAGDVERLTAERDGHLPLAVHAALTPALHMDPRRRTPDAEALGRALAHAARVALPALEPVRPLSPPGYAPPHTAHRERQAPHAMYATRQPPHPLFRPAAAAAAGLARHTAPRALRHAGERSRAVVMAALHRVGRASPHR